MKTYKITDEGCFYCTYFKQFDEELFPNLEEIPWDETLIERPFASYLEKNFESVNVGLPLYIADMGNGNYLSINPHSYEHLKMFKNITNG